MVPISSSIWVGRAPLINHIFTQTKRYYSINKSPLRIALFGTDNFTVFSLRALHLYQLSNPNIIECLNVITRTPKLSGRGLKSIKEAPSAEYAFENNIDVLRAETDAEIIQLANKNYNLAVAVSYGRLIPEQFLSQLTYGGINVHPSLLPDLSGAAPLHRALLRRYPTTGVTVQTLHPTKFDRGRILMHSPEVSISEDETLSTLETKLGHLGSQCLMKVIDEYRFANDKLAIETANKYPPSYAPKITPKERIINFEKNSTDTILLKHRILGRLTAFQPIQEHSTTVYRRMILDGLIDSSKIAVDLNNESKSPLELSLGEYEFYKYSDPMNISTSTTNKPQTICIIRTKDGFISPSQIIFQGYSSQTPAQFQKSMRKRSISPQQLKKSVQ